MSAVNLPLSNSHLPSQSRTALTKLLSLISLCFWSFYRLRFQKLHFSGGLSQHHREHKQHWHFHVSWREVGGMTALTDLLPHKQHCTEAWETFEFNHLPALWYPYFTAWNSTNSINVPGELTRRALVPQRVSSVITASIMLEPSGPIWNSSPVVPGFV